MHARTVLGEGKGVLIRGVLISGVELHARTVLGEGKGVLIREVSSFQRCPSLREGFHCLMYINVQHTGKEIYRNIQNPFVGNVL